MLAPSDVDNILKDLTRYSDKCAYRGYNKHDGLNSPILRTLLGWGKWPRIIAIQAVMRFPINIRPILLGKKSYNPKGLALFAMGFLHRYQYDGNPDNLSRARQLLALLTELQSPGNWAGSAWGYHYPWQDPGFYAPTGTPNAVVTCFVCESFLEAYRITQNPDYLDVVASSIRFFLNDLTVLKEAPDELCLGYMPMPMTMRVMDVSILIGAVIAQHAVLSQQDELLPVARRLLTYVVNQQTAEGAWFYTDPPGDSLIRHDNYHTGFILDALWRYMHAVNDMTWMQVYQKGLNFYAKHHFKADGAPRWMSDQDYPYDIHGAAQGIITFSRHRDLFPDLADAVADWAITHMYLGNGRFAYQKTRFYTKRFTLLRWCNGWMFRALSCYLKQLPVETLQNQGDTPH